MNGREQVLASIRMRIGEGDGGLARSRAAVAEDLARLRHWPRPDMTWQTAEQFKARSLALSCSVASVAAPHEVPAAVVQYLDDACLPKRIAGWSAFAHLSWESLGIDFSTAPVTGTDPVGMTGCFCAIAETGALMLLSGRDTPAATSLLPETHIAVVRATQVLRTMEDAWQMLRTRVGEIPRAVNFIAGPSRTGDVEQTTTIGVHGPRRVHLIIIESE